MYPAPNDKITLINSLQAQIMRLRAKMTDISILLEYLS